MITLAFALAAYLIGSLSCAVFVSRLFGLPDPRTYGNGELSATNLMQSGHTMAGFVTLFCDLIKGAIAVLLTQFAAPYLPKLDYFTDDAFIELSSAAALGVFLGHIFPIYRRLRGSNGVAVAIGAYGALYFLIGGGLFSIWCIALFLSRTVAVASLVTAIALPLVSELYLGSDLRTLMALIFTVLLIWQHRSNIANLIRGTEPKIGRAPGKK